jgi:hypothetical protein
MSGKGGAEAALHTFQSKHREIYTLMTKCENYIDYEQYDDTKSLRSQKRVQSLASPSPANSKSGVNKLVRKEYVDNSRATSEYRAKMYHKRIQKQIDQQSDQLEQWQKALDDLMLIQQEQNLSHGPHSAASKSKIIRPYQLADCDEEHEHKKQKCGRQKVVDGTGHRNLGGGKPGQDSYKQ